MAGIPVLFMIISFKPYGNAMKQLPCLFSILHMRSLRPRELSVLLTVVKLETLSWIET